MSKTTNKFRPEVRQRAIGMVLEHEAEHPSRWAAVSFIAAKIDCSPATYKAKVIHRRGPWRSFQIVEFATLEWAGWLNHRRLLEPIGNIPPAKAEERHYAMLGEAAMSG